MLTVFHDPPVHSPRFSQHPVIAVSDDGFAVPVPKALAAFDGAGELQNALAGVKGKVVGLAAATTCIRNSYSCSAYGLGNLETNQEPFSSSCSLVKTGFLNPFVLEYE